MNRYARATFAAFLAIGLLLPGARPAAAARVPVVAVIVGPVGDATPAFRAQGEQAARVAERGGARVIRVYSPNATWTAVERAVTGASIVVYLGHGNGWPSRYRDAPYPPTQNGFGLNPVAGVDDDAHQYFGEDRIGGLRFARNAVVLLHHLCYASGNTEPGLPEGTRAQSIARVDNYAAGFIRAGARAVVAEGHLGPAYYVQELLRGGRTIESIWASSPERHGNTFAVDSTRSAGYTARLDPDRPDDGYFRSLVSTGTLRATDVRAGATAAVVAPVDPGPPPEPTLMDLGLKFATPVLRERPVAGSPSRLTLPLDAEALRRLPAGVQVGVRWDPILAPDTVVPGETAGPEASAPPSATPSAPAAAPLSSSTPPADDPRDPSPADDPRAAPHALSTKTPPPKPIPTPEPVALVVPERVGSLVQTARGRHGHQGLVVDVAYPTVPGLYRLVATLHQADGTGYDAATQALLTPLIVRVAGETGIAWSVPAPFQVAPGATLSVPVRVMNVGTAAWDAEASGNRAANGRDPARLPAALVASWVSTIGLVVPDPVPVLLDAATSAPGGRGLVDVPVTAPGAPGSYLLVLDIVSPDRGPLSALGADPGIVRVEVTSP